MKTDLTTLIKNIDNNLEIAKPLGNNYDKKINALEKRIGEDRKKLGEGAVKEAEAKLKELKQAMKSFSNAVEDMKKIKEEVQKIKPGKFKTTFNKEIKDKIKELKRAFSIDNSSYISYFSTLNVGIVELLNDLASIEKTKK